MTTERPSGRRWPPLIAAAIVAVTGAWYAAIIRAQDTTRLSDPVPVYVLALLAAVVWALLAVRSDGPGPALFLTTAAGGALLALGILGIFSVGLPLLVAYGLVAWHAVRVAEQTDRRTRWRALGLSFAATVAAGGGLIIVSSATVD